ncbi:YrhK-like protein [Cribrihabitans marinus]|uniref:YrhK-like protein n=1 Tax=Cribrihabitans marinus TaxID=1227549 RepID=A0A1H7CWN4_9RHOB|nr:YrhK family protein [Cribrihabitans marinus]SEJ93999.1 YrhK-like protein [Cribrihabitans marinus]
MLFSRDRQHGSDRQRRIYAAFEIVYTLVDFTAAILFVIGSIMFFSPDWERFGTWLFLTGSLCFAAKPTLRLVRELKLAAIGDVDDLADRLEK